MKTALLIFSLFFAVNVHAKVEVLFHPHDPTLEKIAQWISEAESTVDIAMYNMETTAASPVIKILQSSAVQRRIESGALKIRLIFEGYATPEENEKKMAVLEDLGIDVRFLGKSVKVHHKYAVIDAALSTHRVITGSANWSLSSYRNYNENILFFDQEAEITNRYQYEFNRLWNNSKEFGQSLNHENVSTGSFLDQGDVEVFFNSPRTLDKKSNESFNLTEQVVRLINEAQSEIKIATTRVRLKPVLEALQAAANRGVKIYLVISQDDFMDIGRRAQYLLTNRNLQLRVKFYNLEVSEYMAFQMHNKFMIVDNSKVLSGSFNWSESSEKSHIENLVELSGSAAQDVLPSYNAEFNDLWNMGRGKLKPLADFLKTSSSVSCAITPMALSVSEVRQLLKLVKKCSQD
ncbi:phosphatidylserine/phosphatidylglycerophosphate/cardiolipin synthase family protein [Bdellovibrio bacteriovorus]|uniref:phospholipase D-like domain-containing protein n=1 Tax=Bdellovibrio TaxID=958 RepID=UPI0035A98D5D